MSYEQANDICLKDREASFEQAPFSRKIVRHPSSKRHLLERWRGILSSKRHLLERRNGILQAIDEPKSSSGHKIGNLGDKLCRLRVLINNDGLPSQDLRIKWSGRGGNSKELTELLSPLGSLAGFASILVKLR
jgi:hypothetical protein